MALVTSATSDVVLALVTALFGLLGTLVGAGLTFQAGRSERRARQDDEARNHLLSVSNAIHAWGSASSSIMSACSPGAWIALGAC